jgi:hypothetical protein
VSAKVCCSSPASICYWFSASLVAWGLLSLVGVYWSPLKASSSGTILLAAAIGCAANWARNRTFHCGITAPLFLIGGIVFLLADMRIVHIEPGFVWPFVIAGTGIAFLLEWKYVRQSNVNKGV